ncbi:MAG: hypothetical protein LBD11_01375 [Candidatus Peribacteria bacterium]|nr:hypothetical protein [Candidatus Peribacteria bacterium]
MEAREENGFLIVGDGVREEKFDLSAVKAEILSKVDKKNADVHLTKEDVMFYLTGDAFEVKLMVRNWSLDANDSVDSWGLQGYVLVKRQRK